MGVPLITPLWAWMNRPGGRLKAAKLVGEPDAVTAKLKGEPTRPAAVSGWFVMTGGIQSTAPVTIIRTAVPEQSPLVAVSVTNVVVSRVGVPSITPVVAWMARPGGRLNAA